MYDVKFIPDRKFHVVKYDYHIVKKCLCFDFDLVMR